MLNVIDFTFWLSSGGSLGELVPSKARARVANGSIIRSQGRWVGEVILGPIRAKGGFEVIESGGSFEVLLGKPWLGEARLRHDFENDELQSADGKVCIANGANPPAHDLAVIRARFRLRDPRLRKLYCQMVNY